MPWWAILLIALASLVLGGFLAFCGTLLYIGKGFWQ